MSALLLKYKPRWFSFYFQRDLARRALAMAPAEHDNKEVKRFLDLVLPEIMSPETTFSVHKRWTHFVGLRSLGHIKESVYVPFRGLLENNNSLSGVKTYAPLALQTCNAYYS